MQLPGQGFYALLFPKKTRCRCSRCLGHIFLSAPGAPEQTAPLFHRPARHGQGRSWARTCWVRHFPFSLPGAPRTVPRRAPCQEKDLLSAVAHLLHQAIFSMYPVCQELRADISVGFGIIRCISMVVVCAAPASVLLSASPACGGMLAVGKHLQQGWALLAPLLLPIHIWPGCLRLPLCSENHRPASPRNRNYRNAV